MKAILFLAIISCTFLNSCKKNDNPTILLGDTYQGGTVFYLFEDGDEGYVDGEYHGLITTKYDYAALPWSFNFHPIGTMVNLNQGAINTQKIVSYIGNGNYAAKRCDDAIIDGYDDWYLPSKDELNKMYLNSGNVQNLADENVYYQSSSEADNQNMWIQDMHGNGPINQGNGSKTIPFIFRPIRTF